jgi:probable F420-dependent oxidoreductase
VTDELTDDVGLFLSRSNAWAHSTEAVQLIEELGFGTVWISGGVRPNVLDDVEPMLAAGDLTVCTAVLNIWLDPAAEVNRRWEDLDAQYPGRLVLGLGVSHKSTVEARGLGPFTQPVRRMSEYLDALDAVPADRRLLGALGPKMLQLAAQRTLGSHPYLVTTDYTAKAREVLGDALLAPQQAVVLDDEPARGRATARTFLRPYLELPNYRNNWLRSGFTEADLAHGGSDRLVDALIVVGGRTHVQERIDAHIAAGADHVAVHVVAQDPTDLADAWRTLA